MVYIAAVVVNILLSRFLLDLREAAHISDEASSVIVSSIKFASIGGQLRLTMSTGLFEKLEEDREFEGTHGSGRCVVRDEVLIPYLSIAFPEGLDDHLSTGESVTLSIDEEIEMVRRLGARRFRAMLSRGAVSRVLVNEGRVWRIKQLIV